MKKLAMIAALCAGTAAAAQLPTGEVTTGVTGTVSGDVVTDTSQGLTTQADIATDARVRAQTPPLDTEADARFHAETQTQPMPGDIPAGTEAQVRQNAAANARLSAQSPGPVLAQRLDTYRPIARATYPVCSRTVTDNCVQRNDPGGSNVALAAQGSMRADAGMGGPEDE